MMDKKIEEVVNEQLNTELWSCNLYIAFQVYFEKQELPVLALWLKNQRQKKADRIQKLTAYLLGEDAFVSIRGFEYKADKWQSPVVALNSLFEHEQYFHKQVNDFMDFARYMGDDALQALVLDLYTDEVHVSDFLVELLRMLVKEWRRQLPLE